MKWFVLLLMVLLLVLLLLASTGLAPVHAAMCRSINNHRVCIVDIKRSAKYHWEYRVVTSIDGSLQPIVRYNCRDRNQTQADGAVVPFAADGIGDLICRLLNEPQ